MTTAGTRRIAAIDPSSVHRICSGQVIVDLSTAVKELIENSIDAGATCIDIRLKEYGSESIEVSDNGCGVAPADRTKLMKKYHTSKLETFEDLEELTSFGFRGEALSSLCAVSRVSAVTRVEGEECGVQLEFDSHGELMDETLVARTVGTTIAVKDLFHSLPVRHKEFKKNLKRDYSKLVSILQSYALIYTQVRFLCTNQVGSRTARTTVLNTQSFGSEQDGMDAVKGVVRHIFGRRIADSLVPIRYQKDGICIEGLVSSCRVGQNAKSDSRFFYVNKRPIQFPKAGSVLYDTFKTYSSQMMRPMCVVNFKVDPNNVDVNVTPDKRKVYFHREGEICQIFQQCLIDAWDAQQCSFKVTKVVEKTDVRQFKDQRIDDLFAPEKTIKTGGEEDTGARGGRTVEQEMPSSCAADEDAVQNRFDGEEEEEAPCADQGNVAAAAAAAATVNDGDAVDIVQMREKKQRTSLFDFAMSTPSNAVQPPRACQLVETQSTHNGKASSPARRIEGTKTPLPMDTDDENVNEQEKSISSDGNDMLRDSAEHMQESIDADQSRQPSIINSAACDQNDQPGDSTLPTIVQKETHPEAEALVDLVPSDADDSDDVQMVHSTVDTKQPSVPSSSQHSIECDMDSIRIAVLDRARKIKENKEKAAVQHRMAFQDATMVNMDNDIRPRESAEEETKAEHELERIFKKEYFKQMDVIGQFNLGFIIAKLGQDLFIIDQHASDEKHTFETLQRTAKFDKQGLISPIELELSSREEQIVKENRGIFSNSGFEFDENPANGSLRLTTVPQCKGMTFGSSDVLEMISMIEHGERSLWHLEQATQEHAVYPSRFRALLASKACRSSIMIGTALTKAKMRRILDNLSTLVSPWNCPHGRPTMRHLAYIPQNIGKKANAMP